MRTILGDGNDLRLRMIPTIFNIPNIKCKFPTQSLSLHRMRCIVKNQTLPKGEYSKPWILRRLINNNLRNIRHTNVTIIFCVRILLVLCELRILENIFLCIAKGKICFPCPLPKSNTAPNLHIISSCRNLLRKKTVANPPIIFCTIRWKIKIKRKTYNKNICAYNKYEHWEAHP